MSVEIHPWKIVRSGMSEEWDSLFAAGNGYMCVQDSTYRSLTTMDGIGCFANGKYQYASCIRMKELQILADGERLEWTAAQDCRRELDLRTGLYLTSFSVKTEKGSVRVRIEHFVSAAEKELFALKCSLTPDFDAHIAIKPSLDGRTDDRLWEILAEEEGEDGAALLCKVKENTEEIPCVSVAAAMSCWADGLEMETRSFETGYAEALYTGYAQANETVSLEKYVLCFTSREYEQNVLTTVALRAASRARELSYDELRDMHISVWKARWDSCDVTIDGDEQSQQRIRLALYRLMSAYSGEEGSAAFTTEQKTVCLPVYQAIAGEDAARQLLNTEAAATLQKAALAHAVFDYATYTGDFEYTRKDGLKTLCKIARDFAKKDPVHKELKRLAAWSIGLFLTQAHRASSDRLKELGVTAEEMAELLQTMQKLYDPLTAENAAQVPSLLTAYYLNHLYDEESLRSCFDARTMPEENDSLSCAMYAVLASQLGEYEKAMQAYRMTVSADDTSLSAMAAVWLCITQGFAGMRTAEGLSFRPYLPREWKGYSFRINYRGRLIGVSVAPGRAAIELLDGQPVELTVYGEEMLLENSIVYSLEN